MFNALEERRNLMKEPLKELLTKSELEELTEKELEQLTYHQLREMESNPELLKEMVRKSETQKRMQNLLGEEFLMK